MIAKIAEGAKERRDQWNLKLANNVNIGWGNED